MELKNIDDTIINRDNYRDENDKYVIDCILNNRFVKYKNRFSLFNNLISLDHNPLNFENYESDFQSICCCATSICSCAKSNKKIFNNLVANNIELTELQKYWILKYTNDNLEIKFEYPENIIINGLWVGNKLGVLHKACVESFIRNNHLYLLYTYEEISNLPDNVVIMDANEIIPKELIYKFDNSYAGFSDLFRNCLLYYKGGWYVDLDIYSLKKYDFKYKKIYSFDYHPTLTLSFIEHLKKYNEIVHNKYYIATNPVKAEKNDNMFLSQYQYILKKIFFMKVNELIEDINQEQDFNNLFESNNLLDIYLDNFLPMNKEISFINLLKLNNINQDELLQNKWGEFGPLLSTKNIIKYNRISNCFKPEVLQGIIKYNDVEKYIDKNFEFKDKLRNTYSVDLFFTMWKRKDILKHLDDKEYISNTFIESLLKFSL